MAIAYADRKPITLRARQHSGKFALAAPFTERFFDLATPGGFVGLINANSFMKREFGKALIEEVLPSLDLVKVIDTSGASIPGHDTTPTVLLFGRNRSPIATQVRVVLGRRGEPSTPDRPEEGLVWRSISEHHDAEGFENDFISVASISRSTMSKHPWSLGGGGASDLKALLEERSDKTLDEVTSSIGITSFTLEDDAYLAPREVFERYGIAGTAARPMVTGEVIRDWSIGDQTLWAYFPYDRDYRPLSPDSDELRYLWPYRTSVANSKLFGGKTKVEGGLRWYEYGRLTVDKLRVPLSITFAFVATHNHFVLDRGGKVFNRSAPVIKLPETATEDEHLGLLGYLNSSVACFWMKQVLFVKSSQNYVGDVRDKPERIHYEFAATPLLKLPVPQASFLNGTLAMAARAMEALSGAVEAIRPRAVLSSTRFADEVHAEKVLREHASADRILRQKMACLQDEIDWAVYCAFGLCECPSAGAHPLAGQFWPGRCVQLTGAAAGSATAAAA